MKKIFKLILRVISFLPCLTSLQIIAHAESPKMIWVSSSEKAQWQEMPISERGNEKGSPASTITLDPGILYQNIDGFGGSFSELGWEALVALPKEKRDTALKDLFTAQGANFTLGRAPIGANDFSLGWYSLNETPEDYVMEHFSVDRTKDALLPYIKAAMEYQPKLGVWAVPWCPPSWMTTTGEYSLGRMKQDPQTLGAYALYFSKFVQAWRAEGINLYAVQPQNEPNYHNNIYPQCGWSGEELNVFLRDYLIPQFKKDNVNVEVWYGTIVNKNLPVFIDPVLGDEKTSAGITGVGCQYAARSSFAVIHEKYPDKKLMQTETECNKGANSWEEGLTTYRRIIEDTSNFASSYFFWNMVLDESGLSRWNWKQNSMLTVDRKTRTIRYNPEFYSMRHFSATVRPGARRMAVSGGPFQNIVAFLNLDGSKVLQFENASENIVTASIDSGDDFVKLNVPAKSMNTIIIW
ncbi:MAG: glycoside hydrolase family 30 beta sandwich domain-containing protein [Luteolibacter sp.]